MNIHSSLVMAVYIISRDGVGDGSGLIIKSSFNCILLHYNDVSELARLPLSLCACVCAWERGGRELWADYTRGHQASLSATPADLETGTLNVFFLFFFFAASRTLVDKKTEPSSSGLWGLREVCGDACRSEDSGKHAPNPSRGLTLLTPPLFWRLQHFLVSAAVPTQGCQVHL